MTTIFWTRKWEPNSKEFWTWCRAIYKVYGYGRAKQWSYMETKPPFRVGTTHRITVRLDVKLSNRSNLNNKGADGGKDYKQKGESNSKGRQGKTVPNPDTYVATNTKKHRYTQIQRGGTTGQIYLSMQQKKLPAEGMWVQSQSAWNDPFIYEGDGSLRNQRTGTAYKPHFAKETDLKNSGIKTRVYWFEYLYCTWQHSCIGSHMKAYPAQDKMCTYSSRGGYRRLNCMRDVA